MIKQLFNQQQIIHTIEQYRQKGESARLILDSIKQLNLNKHPLEAILPLQWILESLLKSILKQHQITPSNMVSQNLKTYFKLYPHTILDRKKIENVRKIRNYFTHSGVIRDPIHMPIMIDTYIRSIEFIAHEAGIDLANFVPLSSSEYIQKLAQESEACMEEPPPKPSRKYLKWIMGIGVVLGGYGLYYHHDQTVVLTGESDGTYYQMIEDLQTYTSANLDIIPTKGSVENLKQLGLQHHQGIGLVQKDVLNQFANDALNGQEEPKKILQNIALLRPLLKEEIHIIVKAQSKLEHFSDLQNQTIAIGSEHSGNAITSLNIYEKLFHQPLKTKRYTQHFAQALEALMHNQVDAVILVGGDPLKKLQKLNKKIKLLSYQPQQPLQGYQIGTIQPSHYPHWLTRPIRTLTVDSFLITNLPKSTKIPLLKYLKQLQKSIEINPPKDLHPKWKAFESLDCLPPPKNGMIYHLSTRLSMPYCKE